MNCNEAALTRISFLLKRDQTKLQPTQMIQKVAKHVSRVSIEIFKWAVHLVSACAI